MERNNRRLRSILKGVLILVLLASCGKEEDVSPEDKEYSDSVLAFSIDFEGDRQSIVDHLDRKRSEKDAMANSDKKKSEMIHSLEGKVKHMHQANDSIASALIKEINLKEKVNAMFKKIQRKIEIEPIIDTIYVHINIYDTIQVLRMKKDGSIITPKGKYILAD